MDRFYCICQLVSFMICRVIHHYIQRLGKVSGHHVNVFQNQLQNLIQLIIRLVWSISEYHSQVKFADAKEAIISRQLKKYRQYNGQQQKNIRTKNYLQNDAQKTNDRTTRRTLIKTGGELMCFGRVPNICLNPFKIIIQTRFLTQHVFVFFFLF